MRVDKNTYYGNNSSSWDLQDFDVSFAVYDSKTITPFHHHAKPYLCLLLKGMYQEKSKGKTKVIKPGTILYREVNNEHGNEFSGEKGVCLNLEMKDFSLFQELNNVKLPSFGIENISSLEMYRLLISLKMSRRPDDELNILCYEAFCVHLELLDQKGDVNWVSKIKTQINDDPLVNISLKQLAMDYNLHPNYIVRKFKKVTGLKLSEYLNQERLKVALSKVLLDEESLTSVALSSGYYDQSHFNKKVREHFNFAPKELQRIFNS